MKIHFKLLQQGKSNPVILLKVYDGRFVGRFFKYSTGITIEQAHWDKRKERVKQVISKAGEYSSINQHLDELEQVVIRFKSLHHRSTTLTREELRAFILEASRNNEDRPDAATSDSPEIFSLWQQIIDTAKNSSGKCVSSATRKSKLQSMRLVRKFAAKKSLTLTFDGIDMDFYHEFDAYMMSLGLNVNSRGKHFKDIKAILREAIDRDYKVNLAFQKKSFKVIRGETDSTYLNEEEIKSWLELKLDPILEKRRDTFIQACFVGVRHSDWHKINSQNIITLNGKDLFKIQQQKTGEVIHIPVHPLVRMILNKYHGNPPSAISNQKFNAALKLIAKDASMGFVTINGKKVEKWTTISTHTARRSFATNAYLSRSMDVYQIMKCTGHKTESSFLKYLKLSGKDFALEAAESKFFNDDTYSNMSIAS
jgi:integrase